MSASRRTVIGGALAGLSLGGQAVAAGRPRRIVSLGACLDTILVHVADRSQIAALSHYAREPQGSTISALARTLPYTFETAEEILSLEPDLVLASKHSALATRNVMKRLQIQAALFSVPESVETSLEQVRRIAKLAGQADRGESLIARIEAAIAASAPPVGARPLKAVIYQPNGFAAGRGTLIDELMTRAGFENVAARYGLSKWGNISLEQLLTDPPEVLLSGEVSPGVRSWADRVMTHPALASIAGRMTQARLPERLLYCGGPVMIDTAQTLAAARRKVRGEHL